jgi:hypothetical protein
MTAMHGLLDTSYDTLVGDPAESSRRPLRRARWLVALALAVVMLLPLVLAIAAPAVQAQTAATPTAPAEAASAPAAPPPPLETRIQQLKAELIQLNRDLLILEEELLFPAGTQVAVFVSMDVGRLFELESVQVKLDDKVVAQHLYSPLEVQALHRGGVQRLVLANLKSGKHRIDAFFTGRGPAATGGPSRDYKRGATLEFEKGSEPRYIELRIRDRQAQLQPEFEVKVWP